MEERKCQVEEEDRRGGFKGTGVRGKDSARLSESCGSADPAAPADPLMSVREVFKTSTNLFQTSLATDEELRNQLTWRT